MAETMSVPLDVSAAELFARVGLLADAARVPEYLNLFVTQCDQKLDEVRQRVAKREMSPEKAAEWQQLLIDVCARIMLHPIVSSNNYLKRFAQGVTLAQARHELKQFSVFALQFDVAQAQLVANAPTEDAYNERLQVLLNEKGIPYKDGFEGELTGRWSIDTVHFSWLQNMARGLNLPFEEIGKIWVGNDGARQFVRATFDNYASTDQNIALGASFGIENWAANYLWKPWIAGMRALNASLDHPVDIGYLTYHDAEETHHAQATIDELFENFEEPFFEAERFLVGAERILNEGIQPYYESQLATLPDRDDSWPTDTCDPWMLDPKSLPRVAMGVTA